MQYIINLNPVTGQAVIPRRKNHVIPAKNLYGLKVELSVLPNRLCCHISKFFAVASHDSKSFREHLNCHQFNTKKRSSSESEEIQDDANYSILADMAYKNNWTAVDVITPKKKPPRGEFTFSEICYNRKVSSNRIIIENYFGRLSKSWNMMSAQFR